MCGDGADLCAYGNFARIRERIIRAWIKCEQAVLHF